MAGDSYLQRNLPNGRSILYIWRYRCSWVDQQYFYPITTTLTPIFQSLEAAPISHILAIVRIWSLYSPFCHNLLSSRRSCPVWKHITIWIGNRSIQSSCRRSTLRWKPGQIPSLLILVNAPASICSNFYCTVEHTLVSPSNPGSVSWQNYRNYCRKYGLCGGRSTRPEQFHSGSSAVYSNAQSDGSNWDFKGH